VTIAALQLAVSILTIIVMLWPRSRR